MRGIALCGMIACSAEEARHAEVELPDVSKASFVGAVDNPFLPMPVGATWVYEGATDEGLEHIEVVVLAETRVVNGVDAVVVRDTAYLDGEIAEDTWDWYAQDTAGNVWYLGEDTCEYEGGECVRHAGAWEWGVDGALPGIVMPASPSLDGGAWYQEYHPGVAEDAGEVIGVDESVDVPAGTHTGCVRTHDFSTLDPELDEEKVYCPGIGLALVVEGDVLVELVENAGL